MVRPASQRRARSSSGVHRLELPKLGAAELPRGSEPELAQFETAHIEPALASEDLDAAEIDGTAMLDDEALAPELTDDEPRLPLARRVLRLARHELRLLDARKLLAMSVSSALPQLS